MSTGRHARRRAAKQQEELLQEEREQAVKAEGEEKERRKDIESQRIATMRARFGGQAPDVVGDVDNSKGRGEGTSGVSKSELPSKAKTRDPMRNTLMSMYLDQSANQNNGTKKSKKGTA